jgi:hypothetical protein
MPARGQGDGLVRLQVLQNVGWQMHQRHRVSR